MKPVVPGRPTLAMVKTMKASGIFRHAVDQPAIGGDLARVHAVVDDADAQEQRARDEAVRQHLEDARPARPAAFMAKMPMVTKPIWATDE